MGDLTDKSAGQGADLPDNGHPALADLTAIATTVADIYADRFNTPRDPGWVLHKLAEETGELTGAWLKTTGQGRGQASLQDVADELADVLGFLLVFAARSGIDPAHALRQKWGKYLTPPIPDA